MLFNPTGVILSNEDGRTDLKGICGEGLRISNMTIFRFPLLLLFVAIISGCATREGALRSANYEKIHIEAQPDQIIRAAEETFARHGFRADPESNPQAVRMSKKTPLLFRPVKAGNALVWLILEPEASGWDVYCTPEPDNLYPGGNARRFHGVLTEIKQAVEG